MARRQRLDVPRGGQPTWVTALLISILMIAVFGLGYFLALYLTRPPEPPQPVSVPAAVAAPEPPDPCPTATPRLGDGLPVKDAVVLNVFNATSKQGLAAQAALDFKREGFRILSIENDPRNAKVEGVAEIRYGPNGKKAAQLVQYYLAGATMVELKRDDTVVDVALGPSYTQLADGDAVAAFLAQPKPAPASCASAAPASASATSSATTSPSASGSASPTSSQQP
ncbi:MAG: LytR C-terminal domain-containing protein [Actinomycetales bacterium]|nr:LytR C-terminal domain-containing protein [Actinomycetales bacterium]